MNPSISVITVVFNGGEVFDWTLQSIRHQTYENIEYIIIDGGSTDETLERINKNKEIISKWISEPDDGLYSAMNKGLALASGEYVLFLNAGDFFYDNEVLEKIFSGDYPIADIYYGDTMIIGTDGHEIGKRRLRPPRILTWKNLIDGMLVCHQSFIVRRNITRDYNLEFKIASDYDWMLSCLKKASTVVNTGIIISKFLDGGINKHNILKALYERFLIMSRNYNTIHVIINHFLIAFRFIKSYLRYGRF